MKKKGVSPVVATVLLIAIVIILAVIIFIWAKNFMGEEIVKNNRAVDESCDDVDFDFIIDASAADECGEGEYVFSFNNVGNIPIFGFEIIKVSSGSVVTEMTIEQGTLLAGSSTNFCENAETGVNLKAVPKILGEADSGKQAHLCLETTGVTAQVP
tara:strand:- start:70 stop:537 length:468 start_codon:yes stop_codon:yes gene_type:complete